MYSEGIPTLTQCSPIFDVPSFSLTEEKQRAFCRALVRLGRDTGILEGGGGGGGGA